MSKFVCEILFVVLSIAFVISLAGLFGFRFKNAWGVAVKFFANLKAPRGRKALANGGLALSLCFVLAIIVPLQACNTTWVAQVEGYLPVAFDAANGIIAILQSTGVLAAADSTAAEAVENQITADFTLLCGSTPGQPCSATSLIGTYNSAPNATVLAKIVSVVSDIQTNAKQILTAFHVSNPTTLATLTAATNLFLGLIAEIAAAIPIAASALATGKTPTFKFSRSSRQYKKEFNTLFKSNGFAFAVAK